MLWSLLHTNSTRFGPLQVGLKSNSKPSGFPALQPAPHLRGRGKITFIGLISRGIGKLAGQCSGLDRFHQEAPSGAPTTDSGKAWLRRPVGRVLSPLPHPSHQRPGPAVRLSDPLDPRQKRARCHVTLPPPPLKHRRNAGRRKAFAPARLGWPRRGRVPRARAGGRRAGLAAGPSAPQRLPRYRRGARAGGGTVFAARGRGGGSGAPAAPTAGPGRSAARSRRAAHRPARPPSPARGPRRPARSPLALPGSRPASILDRRFQPPRRCRRIPPFPPPAAAAAARAHLSCPSGLCRPST